MGLFKSTRLFYDAASYADDAARGLMTSMRNEGYEVDGTKLPTGDWDISIKKGNLFRAVLGLQTALKVTVSPADPHVYVKAGIGIFGQQAIPTVLTVCVWWPFVITQIWGMVKQSKLDEMAVDMIQTEFDRLSGRHILSKEL